MMGAAENIADLRSILSIVAEETGALKMEDADEDSVGWTTEGPLPMTFGHVRRAHAALAALEAALSAAEPVKTPFEVASQHIREARVSLLSRAIRQGLNDYGWKNFGTLPEVLMGYIVEAERADEAAHPKKSRDCGHYGGDLSERRDNIGSTYTRSALSAQVQDARETEEEDKTAAENPTPCKVCGGDAERYDFDPLGCSCAKSTENPHGYRRFSLVFDGEEGWTMLPDPDGEYVRFVDANRSSISAQVQDVAGWRPFEFDRYINGKLMAEGVRIERIDRLEDAMIVAARIASRGPNGEVPVLVLRSESSARNSDEASIRAQAVEDVLSALTAHELYQYRPKAFQGFIDYARSELIPAAPAKQEG